MKKKIFLSLTVFILLLCFTTSALFFSEKITADEALIRFHVIANSDSTADQNVKLKVRDAILENYRKEMTALNYREANAFLLSHQNEMLHIANNVLKKNGFSYGVDVKIGNDTYPTKKYGALTLSAGEYRGVKVILGEGKGKNWWCVLFPPLCFVDVTQNVGIAKYETTKLPQSNDITTANTTVTETKITSKLAEWLKQ